MTGILTKEDAMKIKERLWNGELQDRIAGDYKVTQATISRIARGRQYWHEKWPDGTQGEMARSRREELHIARRTHTYGAQVQKSLADHVSPKLMAEAINEFTAAADEQDEEALDDAFGTRAMSWDDCAIIIARSKLLNQANNSPRVKRAIQAILSSLPKAQQTVVNIERLLPNMMETMK